MKATVVFDGFGTVNHWVVDDFASINGSEFVRQNHDQLVFQVTGFWNPTGSNTLTATSDMFSAAFIAGYTLILSVELPVQIGAADEPGTVGDMVPSNNGAHGEKHFVSPPNLLDDPAGDYLTFNAEGVTETEFQNLLQWGPGGEEVPGQPLQRRVPRSGAGKTVLTIVTKAEAKEVTKLNAWIVSATTIPLKSQKKITPTLQLTDISVGYSFTHVIVPAEILTGDRPALEKQKRVAAPGGNNSCGQSLVGGANQRWDNSRQIRGVITNPNSFSLRCVDWLSTEFPNSNVEGNDDVRQRDETNDPYGNGGILTGEDEPHRYWENYIGSPGNTIEEDLHFREFVRLQIGGVWYRISDWQLWRADFKFIKSNVTLRWQDNGGDSYLDQ